MNALSPISLADAIEWQPAPVRRSDRWPVIVSTVLHGALLASALILLHPEPQTLDLAGSSVEVELISLETVSSNDATSQSDAAMDMVSAGAEELTPATSEVLEAIEPEEQTPVTAILAPVTAEAVATQSAKAVQPREIEVMPPAIAEALEPLEEPAELAPVPQPRTDRQKPKAAEAPAKEQPKVEQPAKKPAAKPAPKKSQQAGNGGNSSADARAGAPAGGQKATGQPGNGAAVTKYPGQVLSRLRRALRYPSGGRGAGEVSVQFTVASGGQASGARVVRSSGNPIFDKAAVDTVRRAAPFPPIPPEADRSSWTFTMPLGFVR